MAQGGCGASSKSYPKGRQKGQRRALERADVRAPTSREESGTPFSARQRPPQFPLRPYSLLVKVGLAQPLYGMKGYLVVLGSFHSVTNERVDLVGFQLLHRDDAGLGQGYVEQF